MFTGIVSDIGTIRSVDRPGDLRLSIGCSLDLSSVALGASIACSGVCLTVVDKGDDWFAVDVSAETLSRTVSGMWDEGARLNLERALRVGDELGGHIVTGHVDCVARVVGAEPKDGSLVLTAEVPAESGAGLAAKGSVTLDGASLTVNSVEDRGDTTRFTVNIIPHTADRTTLGQAEAGQQLNVEIDVLARYIQRMMATMHNSR